MITYVTRYKDSENHQSWWYVIDAENQDELSRYEDDGQGMQDAVLDSMWYGYYYGAIDEGLSIGDARKHADEVMKFHGDMRRNLGA